MPFLFLSIRKVQRGQIEFIKLNLDSKYICIDHSAFLLWVTELLEINVNGDHVTGGLDMAFRY